MILHSYAKLNLYLKVCNLRRDNYHNIKTLFERIDLSDRIILKPRQDKIIKIICSYPEVPRDSSNLAYQSAKLLQESFKVNRGVEIKIIKRIPVGSGMAGGSSNAAAVLSGLNKIWQLNLSRQELLTYAKKIGADVAFFLYNTFFALGSGRGDRIKLISPQRVRQFWHILVVPRVKVSTALIYKKWDELKNLENKHLIGLTKTKSDVNILILALKNKDIALFAKHLFNGLEQVTIRLYPEVRRIKERLARLGVEANLMSGSGPAVFGILSSRKEALSLSRRLKKEERSWRIFIAKTI